MVSLSAHARNGLTNVLFSALAGVVTCMYHGHAKGTYSHTDNFQYSICGGFLNLTFAPLKHISQTGKTDTY
jgi:hypothetical protein